MEKTSKTLLLIANSGDFMKNETLLDTFVSNLNTSIFYYYLKIANDLAKQPTLDSMKLLSNFFPIDYINAINHPSLNAIGISILTSTRKFN